MCKKMRRANHNKKEENYDKKEKKRKERRPIAEDQHERTELENRLERRPEHW